MGRSWLSIGTRRVGFVIASPEVVRNSSKRLEGFNHLCGRPAHRANSFTRRIAIFTRSAGDGFVAYSVGHGSFSSGREFWSSWKLHCSKTRGRLPSNGSNVWGNPLQAATTSDSALGLERQSKIVRGNQVTGPEDYDCDPPHLGFRTVTSLSRPRNAECSSFEPPNGRRRIPVCAIIQSSDKALDNPMATRFDHQKLSVASCNVRSVGELAAGSGLQDRCRDLR